MHPVTHNRKNHEVRLHQTDVQEKEKAISEWQRIAESRALDLALAHQTIQLKDNEVTSLKSQLAASQASVDHQKEEKEMRLKAWKDEAEFLNIKLRSKDKAIAELKGDNKRLNEGIEMEKLKKRNIEGIAAKMVETVQKIGELCNLAKPLIEQLSKEKTEGHEIQSPNSSANSGAASLPPASPETKEATGRGQKNWKEDSTDSSSSEQPASSSSSSQHKRSSGSGRYSKRTKGESGSGSDRYSPTSTLQGPPRRQQRERAPVHTDNRPGTIQLSIMPEGIPPQLIYGLWTPPHHLPLQQRPPRPTLDYRNAFQQHQRQQHSQNRSQHPRPSH